MCSVRYDRRHLFDCQGGFQLKQGPIDSIDLKECMHDFRAADLKSLICGDFRQSIFRASI